MTRAENIAILHDAGHKAQAQRMAESESISVEQHWKNETTEYTFADGSVLIASGPSMSVKGAEVEEE